MAGRHGSGAAVAEAARVLCGLEEARVGIVELGEHFGDRVVGVVLRRVLLLDQLLPNIEPVVVVVERAIDEQLVDLRRGGVGWGGVGWARHIGVTG